ncbi:MAG: hypothetical protein KBS54_01685 [Synergistaceae bacterium]|nr:hypothetical protein [Candidatus Equadaptatus faecalis]
MRKIYCTDKYKAYQKNRQKDELLYSRRKHIANNKYNQYIEKQRLAAKIKYKASKVKCDDEKQNRVKLDAPANFSLKENTAEVLLFLSGLIHYINTRQPIYLNLKDVNNVAVDTLLAIVAIFDARNIRDVRGNYPDDRNAYRLIKDYGFFDAIHAKSILDVHSMDRNIFSIKSGTKADSGIVDEIVDFVNLDNITYMIVKKMIYATLLEIIGNANEHAYSSGNIFGLKKNWYLCVHKTDSSILFTVLDNGFGIVRTIKRKTSERAKEIFSIVRYFDKIQDTDLLKAAFVESGRSESGHRYRGKGLPTIYRRSIVNGQFTDFTVISNKAMLNIAMDGTIIPTNLTESFNGTLFSWKIILN